MKRKALALLALLLAVPAAAHKPSDSYLSLRPQGRQIEVQWDIALRDLEHVLAVDADRDGAITWGELRARHAAISTYALSRLRIRADGEACRADATEQLVDRHSDGAYTVLRFLVDCPHQAQRLDVQYGLLFDVDAQHRGLLRVVNGEQTQAGIFTVERRLQSVDLINPSAWRSLGEFWVDGIWHIWLGFDHVLFLLALLMPAVLRRGADGWQVVPDFREAVLGTLKIVTAFTVAHSITLGLATFGTLQLPSRLVESGIAASVIIAALNNAWPLFRDGRWMVGFGFGLLHGFGFASVLSDPGLSGSALGLALFGFNAGVETGQLAIVAAFLPIAFLLRRSWFYQRLTLNIGSSAIAMLALIWLLERSLNLQLAWY